MNGNTKLILILNNEGRAAALKFPAAFPYPETKTVVNPRSKEEVIYYKTDSVKKIGDDNALIYVVADFKLDIDKFADGKHQEPTSSSALQKSADIKLQELRDLLFDQIEYYKDVKDDLGDEELYDAIYERFEYVSREDFTKIIQALL